MFVVYDSLVFLWSANGSYCTIYEAKAIRQSTSFHSDPSFKSKATLGDRSFTCAAPKLWNELPLDIRSARTVNIFKVKLKTHLFRSAFL